MSANNAIKLAVIGRGLIGSAAARHLSKMGHDVALIGPDEPADFSQHSGVFGSHYVYAPASLRQKAWNALSEHLDLASLAGSHAGRCRCPTSFHTPRLFSRGKCAAAPSCASLLSDAS